jgi:outer membrane receptor for monomeric catechols
MMATRGGLDRHDIMCDADNLKNKRFWAAAKSKKIVANVDHNQEQQQQQWMNTKTQRSKQQTNQQ